MHHELKWFTERAIKRLSNIIGADQYNGVLTGGQIEAIRIAKVMNYVNNLTFRGAGEAVTGSEIMTPKNDKHDQFREEVEDWCNTNLKLYWNPHGPNMWEELQNRVNTAQFLGSSYAGTVTRMIETGQWTKVIPELDNIWHLARAATKYTDMLDDIIATMARKSHLFTIGKDTSEIFKILRNLKDEPQTQQHGNPKNGGQPKKRVTKYDDPEWRAKHQPMLDSVCQRKNCNCGKRHIKKDECGYLRSGLCKFDNCKRKHPDDPKA